MPELLVYIGTYTRRQKEGIYIHRFDPSSGALTPLSAVDAGPNPSYLALHPTRPYLYAVNELDEYEGQAGGAVSAFAVDPATGELTFLNRQRTRGAAPCYVSVAGGGRWLLSANYNGGSVAALPIEAGGRLGPVAGFVQHEGSGPNPQRQKGPHAHSILPDPAGRYILACDLGLDRVLVYRLEPDTGRLLPNDEPWVAIHPGAGPRHLAFHPNGRYAYLVGEIDSTLTALAYDGERGVLRVLQTVSTLPEGFSGESTGADVHVAPSGRFVYASNRGHDSIAIFAVNPANGELTLVGHEPTQGRTPRNFALDPSGAFLLAANQDSDTVVTFRVDPGTGRLMPTGQVVDIPAPVCVRMAWSS